MRELRWIHFFAELAPSQQAGHACRLQMAAPIATELSGPRTLAELSTRATNVLSTADAHVITPAALFLRGLSSTTCIGVTGVLLDPPYSADARRDPEIYSVDDLEVAHRVREWAVANGDNPKLRIALCGYEGEHEMPPTWRCIPWKAHGGYGNASGNVNRTRERIWLSPNCLDDVGPLFAARKGD
jgi:hypothetical protein